MSLITPEDRDEARSGGKPDPAKAAEEATMLARINAKIDAILRALPITKGPDATVYDWGAIDAIDDARDKLSDASAVLSRAINDLNAAAKEE